MIARHLRQHKVCHQPAAAEALLFIDDRVEISPCVRRPFHKEIGLPPANEGHGLRAGCRWIDYVRDLRLPAYLFAEGAVYLPDLFLIAHEDRLYKTVLPGPDHGLQRVRIGRRSHRKSRLAGFFSDVVYDLIKTLIDHVNSHFLNSETPLPSTADQRVSPRA